MSTSIDFSNESTRRYAEEYLSESGNFIYIDGEWHDSDECVYSDYQNEDIPESEATYCDGDEDYVGDRIDTITCDACDKRYIEDLNIFYNVEDTSESVCESCKEEGYVKESEDGLFYSADAENVVVVKNYIRKNDPLGLLDIEDN